MSGSYSSIASRTHDKFDVLRFQNRSDDAQHFGKLGEYDRFFGSLRTAVYVTQKHDDFADLGRSESLSAVGSKGKARAPFRDLATVFTDTAGRKRSSK